MATCKDCLYHPHCYSRIAFMMDVDEVRGELLTDLDKRCKGFKNKADVVPVVRCKDCMFWDTEKIGMVDECVCKLHSIEGIYSKYKLPNDFCSYGERKVDNAE